jgi:hypothetical protein
VQRRLGLIRDAITKIAAMGMKIQFRTGLKNLHKEAEIKHTFVPWKQSRKVMTHQIEWALNGTSQLLRKSLVHLNGLGRPLRN